MQRYFLAILILVIGLAGCSSTGPTDRIADAGTTPGVAPTAVEKPVSKRLALAETLYRQGRYSEALIECVNVANEDPLTPGLAGLRKKIADEVKITYTPIPYSLYYDHSSGTKSKHIKGIMHEYLGIVYYWWKGYI